jgi:hypothetical protein
MKNKVFNRVKQFFIHGVVARFYCFFLGHNISQERICKRCHSEFGVPKMKKPPNPP